jgi:peptidoglycan/LPS O-acetylase OafA/YrhL
MTARSGAPEGMNFSGAHHLRSVRLCPRRRLLTGPQRLLRQDSPMGSLRLILALSVAFGHFGLPLSFPTADIAVQSFFVISGFYMALVLNEKYGPDSYWLFISNRLLRLWPTYFVVLVLSFAIADNWKPIASLDGSSVAYFFVSQLLIVGQELYFFLFINNGAFAFTLHPAGTPGLLYTFAPIPQAWTLGLEIYFYLLAPFIVRRGPIVIAAILAASLLLRIALQCAFGLSGEPWTYRFFPSEIALFLAGSLGYYVYSSRSDKRRSMVKTLLTIAAISLFACLALGKWDGISRFASWSLLGIVIIGVPRLFEATRNIAWDRYLGELSYPLYICHFLFGWILLPQSVFGAYSALFLSMAASILLYHFVDRPIDKWRQSRFEKTGRATVEGRLVQAV